MRIKAEQNGIWREVDISELDELISDEKAAMNLEYQEYLRTRDKKRDERTDHE